jgi:YbbR domain-containing protein
MKRQDITREQVVSNLIWFLGALVLAFLVWVWANLQSNPILQEPFGDPIPIEMTPDEGMMITSVSARNATVVVRSQKSVMDLLKVDEINVWADLSGLGPGTHTVELRPEIARQARIVDISPSQVRVTLEERAQRQVPLHAVITHDPPLGFTYSAPEFSGVTLNQVLVSGPASKVDQVAAVNVEIDLTQQRNPYEGDLKAVAVTAEGTVVSDVTLEPGTVHVAVSISRRDDVQEVRIRPNLIGEVPDGYVLSAVTIDPQAALVSGTPDALAVLPDLLDTNPIDLNNKTASFEQTVSVPLDDTSLVLLTAQTVTVSVEINAQTTSRQFDGIAIEVAGLGEGLAAKLSPDAVTVLITGPEPELVALRVADIHVTVDLTGLAEGNYQVTPQVAIAQVTASSVTILPAEVDIEITPAGGQP